MKKNNLVKMLVILTFFLFLASSLTQAVVINISDEIIEKQGGDYPSAPVSGGGSSFSWEDDFLDEGRIDTSKSYNYILDKSQGIVKMKDTYEAWYNPDWTRMKVIDVYNSGSQTFNDYVLDIVVYHDSDMQNDFGDLRFTDSEGNDLYYWLGEHTNGESANVLVRVPQVPPGHTDVHMFYGDPSADDQSNFEMIFTWDDRTSPDVMVSYKNYLEGAWDADVEWGGSRFLVAWEERLGPEDLPNSMERSIYCVIHGRSYDEDGGNPKPSGDADINIRVQTGYHAENPSIAYGSGKFLVVWEENPANIADRFEADIKGAFVTLTSSGGTASSPFTICDAPSLQCDPCVAYDSSSGKFFVVWEDARDSTNNYDVYGRMISSSGPSGSDFQVAAGANCQDEPWVCSDGHGTFMVVYEDGSDPETGPFGLKAQRYDSSGNKVGSTITIASASSSKDHIFPSVAYCQQTERYFVAWSDADLSSGQWRGNVWGKILDKYGNTVYDNFIVQSGYNYIRTDVVPYLDTMFFISYDGVSDLWGKLVSSDGVVQTNEHMLSDGSSQRVDWNNLAVGSGKIMAVWEDERDQASEYADAFGSVWQIYRATGSPQVSYNMGDEKQIVTTAVLVSKTISPGSFQEWEEFGATYSTPIGSIRFDILNEQGTQIVMGNVNPGRDISSIQNDAIRLKATFERSIPRNTPVLDKWSVTYVGGDYEPPWTEHDITPATPDGENGWYTVSVEVTLYPHDDVSPPEEIVTYYKLNDGTQKIYSNTNKPMISTEQQDNTFEYWSVDAADNEEIPHNYINSVKIDRTKPTVTITSPAWGIVDAGDVEVSGTVYESTQGSGVNRIEVYFNGGKIPDDQVEVSVNKDYFEWHFTAEGSETSSWLEILGDIWAMPHEPQVESQGESQEDSQEDAQRTPLGYQYDIEVRAYDDAGNMGNAYVTVSTPKAKSMNLPIFEFIQRIIENFQILQYILFK